MDQYFVPKKSVTFFDKKIFDIYKIENFYIFFKNQCNQRFIKNN